LLKNCTLGSGDEVRRWQPPKINGQSCYFVAVNRSKKSVALNLASAEGQMIARQLATKSDVLIENFKTGQMQKFGLDYASLSKEKPDLIYCSITGKFSNLPN
jgi:crotonobetainyl-CoA:carnitine CoA-transferase CaiB-like acyl-CoA transferase